MPRRWLSGGAVSLALALVLATAPPAPATTGPGAPGDRAIPPHRPRMALNQSDSSNWSGHSQGILDQGTPFTQVSGEWTVPAAKAHEPGRNEYSSAWIGIGGGCLDSDCFAIDGTLIQAGTAHEVDRNGDAYYYAWWELIPAPAIEISDFDVRPGHRIHVDIRELLPAASVWSIKIDNRTTGQSWQTTVPYVSGHGSAEWIVETPLVIGGGSAGISNMPRLSPVRFDNARRNGVPANLSAASRVRLVDGNTVVAVPSGPDAERDGFNLCTYATSCPVPGRT